MSDSKDIKESALPDFTDKKASNASTTTSQSEKKLTGSTIEQESLSHKAEPGHDGLSGDDELRQKADSIITRNPFAGPTMKEQHTTRTSHPANGDLVMEKLLQWCALDSQFYDLAKPSVKQGDRLSHFVACRVLGLLGPDIVRSIIPETSPGFRLYDVLKEYLIYIKQRLERPGYFDKNTKTAGNLQNALKEELEVYKLDDLKSLLDVYK